MKEVRITTGERLLRIHDVARKVAMGRSTIYRWIAAGRFPAGLELAPQVTRWRESDIDAWIATFDARSEDRAPEPRLLEEAPPTDRRVSAEA